MKTLIFNLFLIFGANSIYADNGVLKSVIKMRNVSIFMRAAKQVCATAAKNPSRLSGAGESVYQGIMDSTVTKLSKSPDVSSLKQEADQCLIDCSCQTLLDLSEKMSDPETATMLKAVVQTKAEKMTDANFEQCQRKLKLNCQSADVQAVIRAMDGDL